jgi:hypothetical protein
MTTSPLQEEEAIRLLHLGDEIDLVMSTMMNHLEFLEESYKPLNEKKYQSSC